MHATVVAGACGLAAMIIGMRTVARHRPPAGGRIPADRSRHGRSPAVGAARAIRGVARAAQALHGGPSAGGAQAAARHLRAALGCAAVAVTDGEHLLAWDGTGTRHAPDAPEHARTGEVRCADPHCPVRHVVAVPFDGGTLAAYGPDRGTAVTRDVLDDVALLLEPTGCSGGCGGSSPHKALGCSGGCGGSSPHPALGCAEGCEGSSPHKALDCPGGCAGSSPRTAPAALSRERASERRPAVAEVIPAGVGSVIRFVRRADVRYAEAHGDYARLYTQAGSHLVRVSLAALEEAWGDAGFVRIHRSHLVALAHVDEMVLDGGRCTLRVGGARLTVSRRNTGALRDRLVRDIRPGSP
ncbi:LytR/AlgR family response regulator transcription factor [Actinomadura litoris]|uniref:LytR/AlgR family response regulator transcription factor n=1 Tax=Actinomadura litoris TaxID=2678616 RepID=UPI001FA775A9|nr:LytTR family DNA-binding domain-containing protein [Actinomadura litoris]